MGFLQVYGYHDFDKATLVLMRQFDDTAAGEDVFETGSPVQPTLVNRELGEYLTRPLKEDHTSAYFDAELVIDENRLDRVDFSTVDVNQIRSGKELSDDDYQDSLNLQVEDDFYEDAALTEDMSFMYAVSTNRVVDITEKLNTEIYEEPISNKSVDYFSVFGKNSSSLVIMREDVKNQRFEMANVDGISVVQRDRLCQAYSEAKNNAGVDQGKLFTMRNVTFSNGEVDMEHAYPMKSTAATEYLVLTSGIKDAYGNDMGVEETIWDNAEANSQRLAELEKDNHYKQPVSYDDLDL